MFVLIPLDNPITPGNVFEPHFDEPFVDDFYDEVYADRKQHKYHMCHGGGIPARDFYLYLPLFIFLFGWAGGAFDEAKEEGSQPFQNLMGLRKAKKNPRVLQESVQQLDDKNILRVAIRALNWQSSKYIDDTRYVLRDLYIDYRMFSKSPRLYSGLITGITMMENHIKIQHIDTIMQYFKFFNTGSVIVYCDIHEVHQDKNDMIFISEMDEIPPEMFDASKECDFDAWNAAVGKLAKLAAELAAESEIGLFN